MCFFFFNDTATTEIYTLSLHDALPICGFGALARYDFATGSVAVRDFGPGREVDEPVFVPRPGAAEEGDRSEEHTSELQSRQYLVCRLLLEKKKRKLQAWASMPLEWRER